MRQHLGGSSGDDAAWPRTGSPRSAHAGMPPLPIACDVFDK